MPAIPIIRAKGDIPLGVPNERAITTPQPVVTPLAEGLADVAMGAQTVQVRAAQQAAYEAQLAERARREQERDEAVLYTSNTITAGALRYTEALAKARETSNGVGYTDTTMKDFEAWSKEVTKAAPQAARVGLQTHLNTLRGQVHSDAFRFETASRYAKLRSDYAEGVDADARTLSVDAGQITDVLARRRATLETLGLPAEERARLWDQSRDLLATSAAMGLAERDPERVLATLGFTKYQKGARRGTGSMRPDGSDADAAIKADPVFSMLPPERLQAVLHRAQSLVAQKEALRAAQAQAAQAGLSDQVRGVVGMLNDGFTPSAQLLADTQRAVRGTKYEGTLTQAIAEAGAVQQFRLLPPVEQRAQLNAVRAQIGTPEGARLYEKLDRVVNDAQTRLKNDAFSYGVQVLGVTPTPFNPADPIGSLTARAPQAKVMQARFGQAVSPVTPQEADQIATILKGLPPDQKAAKLAEFGRVLGDRQMIGALARQLDEKDKALGVAMMFATAQTTQNRPVAQIILRGDQARRDGTVKPDAAKETGWRAQIAKEIGDAYQNEELRTHMIEAAYLVQLGLQAEGTGDVRRAVRMTAGRIIDQDDGTKLPLPYGWEERDFRKRLQSIKPEQVGDVMVGQVKVPAAEFVRQLPKASLVHAGQGKYSVRAGGGFVTDAAGNRLVLDLNR